MTLPRKYAWLLREPGPKILVEALKTHGLKEIPGPANEPEILRWARVAGVGTVYQHDSTAWCGLAVAYWAVMAGYRPPDNPLWARNWAKFGTDAGKTGPMLGDILVFSRTGGGGHVGLYVADDADAFHVLGGNQSDQVNISRIAKSRLLAVRRCDWKIGQPKNVRRIQVSASGALSTNEA